MLSDEKLSEYRAVATRWMSVDRSIALALLDEIARLRAELDRRPEITPEDARIFMRFKPVPARDSREGPVMHALRAHARKAVRP